MTPALRLELRRAELAVDPPLSNAGTRWDRRSVSTLSLCERTGDGTRVVGCGEASPLPGYSPDTPAEVERALAALGDECLARLGEASSARQVLDAVATELIRVRGARQHECRLCKSRRSVAALDAGADEEVFEAVDAYADSDLPAATKAALALTDTMIWTPYAVPRRVATDALEHLAPEQVVEVVLDVARNAANKIAVALGADAAAVTDGVELFTTDTDGNLTVYEGDPR